MPDNIRLSQKECRLPFSLKVSIPCISPKNWSTTFFLGQPNNTVDYFDWVQTNYPSNAPPDDPLRIKIGETVLTTLSLFTCTVGLPAATLQGYFLLRVAKERTLSFCIYRAIV
eukprot:sb/3476972/